MPLPDYSVAAQGMEVVAAASEYARHLGLQMLRSRFSDERDTLKMMWIAQHVRYPQYHGCDYGDVWARSHERSELVWSHRSAAVCYRYREGRRRPA